MVHAEELVFAQIGFHLGYLWISKNDHVLEMKKVN